MDTFASRSKWAGRPALYALAALGLLVVLVTFTPLVRWWGRRMAGNWGHPKGEVLIVLGGAEPTDDGVISYDTYLRTLYAIREYRQQRFHLVLLCGGGSPATVADSMRDLMEAEGVPASVLRVENRSTSTRENALFVQQLLAGVPGRKILLTSDYHIARSLRVFRKVGLDVAPRPIPDAVKRGASFRTRWPAFVDLIEEEVKTGYYFGRGWL